MTDRITKLFDLLIAVVTNAKAVMLLIAFLCGMLGFTYKDLIMAEEQVKETQSQVTAVANHLSREVKHEKVDCRDRVWHPRRLPMPGTPAGM
jgi:sensor domain CHASE-containing protein